MPWQHLGGSSSFGEWTQSRTRKDGQWRMEVLLRNLMKCTPALFPQSWKGGGIDPASLSGIGQVQARGVKAPKPLGSTCVRVRQVLVLVLRCQRFTAGAWGWVLSGCSCTVPKSVLWWSLLQRMEKKVEPTFWKGTKEMSETSLPCTLAFCVGGFLLCIFYWLFKRFFFFNKRYSSCFGFLVLRWGGWPHLWHVEVPRPGIKSEPQLWPTPKLWQHQILNALGQTGDLTWVTTFHFLISLKILVDNMYCWLSV